MMQKKNGYKILTDTYLFNNSFKLNVWLIYL